MELEIREVAPMSDGRGAVAEILKRSLSAGQIKEVLFITSRPGAVRGNHYHKRKLEYLAVVRGRARLVYEDVKTQERKELVVTGDRPTVVRSPVNVAHAVQNVGEEDLCFLEINGSEHDPGEPDTFKKVIV